MTKPWHGDGAPADPVECYNLRKQDQQEHIGLLDLRAHLEDEKLMADLVALCEELSDALATALSEPGATFNADSVRHDVIMQTRNPDGTRRWPGVGE